MTVPDVRLQLYANKKYSLSRFPRSRSRARYHQYSVDASSSPGTDVHGRGKMAKQVCCGSKQDRDVIMMFCNV